MPVDKKTVERLEKLVHDDIELKQATLRSRRQELAKFFVATYSVIVVGVAVSYLATSGFDRLFVFGDNDDKGSGSSLQSQVDDLKKQTSDLQHQIKNKGDTPDVSALSARVDNLQSQVDALSATILESPDKALTARLLREKQTNLESQVEDLKDDNTATRQAFVNFLVVVLGAPIVGGVITWIVDHRRPKDERSESGKAKD